MTPISQPALPGQQAQKQEHHPQPQKQAQQKVRKGGLYGAINTLLERGWIVLYSAELGSRKKKEYVITPAGRSAFDAEMARLRELVRNGEKMEDET